MLGAMKEGPTGFLKGVGRGVIGYLMHVFTYNDNSIGVKPTVGALDLLGKTFEGLRNTTASSVHCTGSRKRLPRYFPRDGSLEVVLCLSLFLLISLIHMINL